MAIKRTYQVGLSTLIYMFILVALSFIVGCYGLFVSYVSRDKVDIYYTRCITLMEENSKLREQLANVAPASKKVEMVFNVGDDEFAPKTLARANRNLLNIRYFGGEKFKGTIGVDKHNHVIFSHPAFSVRAGAIILKNYEKKHGIKTIKDMIHRFAEGNREQYIKFVCKWLDVHPTQKISITKNLHRILPAMIKFETGEDVGMEYTEIINAIIS
ncbi:hypothetical protein B5F76_07580 [Desulfovibrio sp. An276]|uniref:hypothetical protein n=1 Tax=Desulfovibrio sp. An276 TaxID=1965618 RepID=UPI000B39781C|nr:hypothetical protein [Desulfovibrio sp. An276]OUO52279.1 hypothetical protein B5F76_07580 [Desulfovibrio sp. An276]